jgi:hypothetical protein
MKNTTLILGFVALLLPRICLANDEGELAKLSAVTGSFDEGEAELTSRRCRPQDLPPQIRDGKYRSYLTHANGDVSVVYHANSDTYEINHRYGCRMRTRVVSGCGGVQLSTDDSHPEGVVTFSVSVSRRGVVHLIHKSGVNERCGQSIMNIVASKLEGVQLP